MRSDYPDDINNEGYNHSLHHTPPETVEALREKCIKQRDADIRIAKFLNWMFWIAVVPAVVYFSVIAILHY